jgi:hypothetical protein
VVEEGKMKKIWVVIITVLITAGLIGGGGYYYLNKKYNDDKDALNKQISDLNDQIDALNNQSSSTPTTTTVTTDPTSDWKTYTNSKYGISFKYPKTWSIEDDQYSAKNVDEMVPISQQNVNFDRGVKLIGENTNKKVYVDLTSIADYSGVEGTEEDISAIKSVYSSKAVGTALKLWLPPSNAGVMAGTTPSYIESSDKKYRGIVYFANIGQDYNASLDCMIILTDNISIFQLRAHDVSDKGNEYFEGATADNFEIAATNYQNYMKGLTIKSTDETVIDDYNETFKYIGLSVNNI